MKRVFHCSVCESTDHTARNHYGSKPREKRGRSIKTKEQQIYMNYRLEYATYLAWLQAGCAICRRDLRDRTPDVDHGHGCDHLGKGSYSCRACVRGLLCRSCNLRVGAYERGLNSDPDIAAYLGATPAREPDLTLF